MIIINSHRLIKEAFIKRGEDFANRPVMYGLNQMNLFDGELLVLMIGIKWFETPLSYLRTHAVENEGVI